MAHCRHDNDDTVNPITYKFSSGVINGPEYNGRRISQPSQPSFFQPTAPPTEVDDIEWTGLVVGPSIFIFLTERKDYLFSNPLLIKAHFTRFHYDEF